MKILTITAQKPNSTGSGVYLTELVKGFAKMGHTQAVLAGVYHEDNVEFPEGVSFYPVYFKTEKLPFPIAGMSDEMPYESTVYGQMTGEMTEQFKAAFREKIREAASEFKPDLVICHHLYLVTALAREEMRGTKVVGFCHNTDLRQLKKIPLEREFIKEMIPKLDQIFALHEEQKKDILNVFPTLSEEKITVAGSGYNSDIFYRKKGEEYAKDKGVLRIAYVGKISEKKGVASLIKSLSYLDHKPSELEVNLIGGAGNKQEYEWILSLAKESRYHINFLGKHPQSEVADILNKSDIFILPSFSEGLPLTIMEAMACGCKVVVTDLPGIRPWTEANVKNAPIIFVAPPLMKNVDETVEESLPDFEKALAGAIVECDKMETEKLPDLSGVSWEHVCRKCLL